MAEPSKENDERVVRLLTSGDEDAVSVLIGLGSESRTLGQRWWCFLYLALLWSGLTMLAPRFGDDDSDGVRWQRWRLWLRTRSLSIGNATEERIDPLGVVMRVERFEYNRWQRRYARDGRRFAKEPGRRLSGSLDTHFLHRAFAWLFVAGAARTIAADELETHRRLVSAFWAHQEVRADAPLIYQHLIWWLIQINVARIAWHNRFAKMDMLRISQLPVVFEGVFERMISRLGLLKATAHRSRESEASAHAES